jgi:hypothetical protein
LIQRLRRSLLDVRYEGGHKHVRIEGKYTKVSGVYVDGIAGRIALAFYEAAC